MEQVEFNISLAGLPIGVKALYPETREFCKDYLTEQLPELCAEIRYEDIEFERAKSAAENMAQGADVHHFSDRYLETLAVYRKIAEQLPKYGIVLFHGSAISVDGAGYLFTAASGTGKSTHTRLWRQAFGSRAVMINDDKPLLKITPEGVTVYGTPWDGKHRLSTNAMVPLKALCVLNRAETNHITRTEGGRMYSLLLQQTYRPRDPEMLIKTLSILDDIIKTVPVYKLGCNMEQSAAQVAFDGMNNGKEAWNMKLNKNFITHEADGEQIMVSTGGVSFAGLVRSNKTAAFIVDELKKDVTKEQIVSAMLERYDAPKDIIENDVESILASLRSIGALDE